MNIIFGIGLIFILGLFSSKFTEKIKTPAITAYIVLGVVIGPYFLRLIPASIMESSAFISNIALSLIAFNIGQNFSKNTFRQIGTQVIWISVFEALGAFIFVTVALSLLKIPFHVAIVFGSIAAASAPAAILMVVRELKACR